MGTVFPLGWSQHPITGWEFGLHCLILEHLAFSAFKNFLITEKKIVSAPIVNISAMPSPPETTGPGRTDTPNEATPLAQCNI